MAIRHDSGQFYDKTLSLSMVFLVTILRRKDLPKVIHSRPPLYHKVCLTDFT
jgi:hypothetical protein